MNYEEIINHRNKGPYTNFMGMKTVEIQEGYAKTELEVKEEHYNPLNSVHGGCLFSLGDTVSGSASAGRGERMTTIDANINYLSPAINVEKLTAEAFEVKYGKTISVFNVEIKDEKENLIATGVFTYYNLSNK